MLHPDLLEILRVLPGNDGLSGKTPETEENTDPGRTLREIVLIGAGTGSVRMLTKEAEEALQRSDVLIGAARLLKTFKGYAKNVFESYKSEEILEFLEGHPEYRTAAVLFSGDVGFYSGAKKLLAAIEGRAVESGEGNPREKFRVSVICGISSVQYFCAKCGIPWEDVCFTSLHGRDSNIAAAVSRHRRVFSLTGDRTALADLAFRLRDLGFGDLTVRVGVNLSLKDEKIFLTTVSGLAEEAPEGLTVLLFENPEAERYIVTHGIPDEDFIRGDVPMTKEEIRSVALSKLRLSRNSVVFDIGAGTGSAAVEAAKQADGGRVYAVERKAEAVELIRKNAARFGVSNLEVVPGEAPEILEGLPAPTHAFIGGSGGRLAEICNDLLLKNPHVRIVITAVTLEGIAAASEFIKKRGLKDAEITQISAARSRLIGNYHMMAGMNPVFIISFGGV